MGDNPTKEAMTQDGGVDRILCTTGGAVRTIPVCSSAGLACATSRCARGSP